MRELQQLVLVLLYLSASSINPLAPPPSRPIYYSTTDDDDDDDGEGGASSDSNDKQRRVRHRSQRHEKDALDVPFLVSPRK